MVAPLDSPVMADFVARLDEVNAIADRALGFVWRYQTEEGDATAVRPFGDDAILINYSVWKDPAALRDFVYRSAHSEVMRRRREWFERTRESYLAMWWVPAGHRPSVEEAVGKLEQLRREGPSAAVFTFAAIYPPPDEPSTDSPLDTTHLAHCGAM
jgi:hypothetical protein